jgi:hypothetical protein
MRRAFVAVASAVVLAGCGAGSGGVDQGGFTAGQRKAAQDALIVLSGTSLWDTAAKASYTQGQPPTACVVHIVKPKPLTFKVFMTWIPDKGINLDYVWLQAVIGPEGLRRDYSFRLGNEFTKAALTAHYGDVFSKPVENCLVLQNGGFALVPK